jgi:hypothetical protein
MHFFAELLAGKTGAVSMTVMSRVRSSMNDPEKNRSYAKLSQCHSRFPNVILAALNVIPAALNVIPAQAGIQSSFCLFNSHFFEFP